MRVDELPLRDMRDKLVDQRATVVLAHAEDAARMGRQVERFAPGLGDRAHDHLRYRRHSLAFLIAEVGEAEAGARVEDRMLCDERVEAALGFLRQRVVGRPLVGKLRMSADRWNRRT